MTFVLETTPDGINLVVTGRWSSAAAEVFERGDADGLTLNYARGFQERDLEFLEGLPVRRLFVLDRTIVDLSPIYSLTDSLAQLTVQSDPRAHIDLNELRNLRKLATRWSQISDSIGLVPRLEVLGLLGYAEEDFRPIESLTSLTSLVVGDRSRVRSLRGIESMIWLSELAVNASSLEDITPLHRAALPILRSLSFELCKRILDIEPVSAAPSLERFNFSDAGTVLSVSALTTLVDLQYVHMWGSTRIEDGDLSPIANLPKLKEFRIMNRRHYSPSRATIEEIIERRTHGQPST